MSIIPREVQEKLEGQEEQIRMLNLKLKKSTHDKEQILGKLKTNRFWLWFFLLSLIGVLVYIFIFYKEGIVPSDELEGLKIKNESLEIEKQKLMEL